MSSVDGNFAIPDFAKILSGKKLIKEMATKLIETEGKLQEIERLVPLMEQGPTGPEDREFQTGLKIIQEGVKAIRTLLKMEIRTAFQEYLATLDPAKVTPAVDYIVQEAIGKARGTVGSTQTPEQPEDL